jgi:hypothetical protein
MMKLFIHLRNMSPVIYKKARLPKRTLGRSSHCHYCSTTLLRSQLPWAHRPPLFFVIHCLTQLCNKSPRLSVFLTVTPPLNSYSSVLTVTAYCHVKKGNYKAPRQTRSCTETPFYFICGLLNDDTSSSDNIASNDRMINERWRGKDMEGISRGLI